MRFVPLISPAGERDALLEEYKNAYRVDRLCLGERRLYFRSGLRVFYIPYADIRRYFRRVMRVPTKLCCGMGDLTFEHLVICGDGGELAQIGLSGEKAARAVMARMALLAPDADAGLPPRENAAPKEGRTP